MGQDVAEKLVESLRSALGLLDREQYPQLHQDGLAVCNHAVSSSFRIAVFGPFNYGKSTLLNALLGNRALPIDLIPTTGAAIRVSYGEELRTRIVLTNGTKIAESGTEVLKQFALLDGDRQMRQDVSSVQIFCPHPFLQNGVELLDLPGTNDREAQDALVRDQLLTVDLVVQVLDARKLMTLGERENLRDWLLDRGIKTVVFVANFINLLEAEDQKQVQSRLRFVAESFRADLPDGVSNLYRVDALPALRARLKGDMAAANVTGLPMFESALQAIVASRHQGNAEGTRLPRIVAIATQVQRALQAKVEQVGAEVGEVDQNYTAKLQIKQRAEKLLQQGFAGSMIVLRDWLSFSTLVDRYQTDAASALERGSFNAWEQGAFRRDLLEHQQAVVKWVTQATEMFGQPSLEGLVIPFSSPPSVSLPPPPTPTTSQKIDPNSVAVATGIGFLFGGPIGAAVAGGTSYLLTQNMELPQPQSDDGYRARCTQAYEDAAKEYLSRFSLQGLPIVDRYQPKAQHALTFQPPPETPNLISKRHELTLLQTTLNNLDASLGAAIPLF